MMIRRCPNCRMLYYAVTVEDSYDNERLCIGCRGESRPYETLVQADEDVLMQQDFEDELYEVGD